MRTDRHAWCDIRQFDTDDQVSAIFLVPVDRDPDEGSDDDDRDDDSRSDLDRKILFPGRASKKVLLQFSTL
ncbi:hypothetical protein [Nocardia cerradoensis]|uniref:hypothetical protein n=1 Tax=Nocardia cerradoensis TaxID=85688 RepID=UPI000B8AC696|nr:hypothetical protein [Nocardia cerradoensis]